MIAEHSSAQQQTITLGIVFLVSFLKEFHNDEFGFIMKINLPHRMNQGMNQWKKMRNCSMWVYKKKKRRKNERKKKQEQKKRRKSTWGAEGAEAKIEKNIQLHYLRPPSIKK